MDSHAVALCGPDFGGGGQPFEGSVHMALQSRGPRKLSASSTLKAIEQHLLEVGFSTTTLLFKGNYGSDYDR